MTLVDFDRTQFSADNGYVPAISVLLAPKSFISEAGQYGNTWQLFWVAVQLIECYQL